MPNTLLALAWIVAGGGSIPELNQVSIEQDLADAERVLAGVTGAPGELLFASGPGDRTVQISGRPSPLLPADAVRASLASLFDPRGGRTATYRPTILRPIGPATADRLLASLEAALTDAARRPLTVYLAGHGQMGPNPRDNWVDLWEESALTPISVARALERHPGHRTVRFVITSCHSGGFGELAFAGADPALGPATTDRCGLFAAPWDLPASGCDPNPDRAAHEGYARHFLPALAAGKSLLEAHTEVRVTSPAPDVPTTTSERWLRHSAPTDSTAATKAFALPEEDRVVEALTDRLGVKPRAASDALKALEASIDALDAERRIGQPDEDAAWRRASASVLARWPVLNDPWHPDFEGALEANRADIKRHLARDPAVVLWRSARRALDEIDMKIWDLRDRSAPLERLARAVETRDLAARLHAQGGPDWTHYLRLLECERGQP